MADAQLNGMATAVVTTETALESHLESGFGDLVTTDPDLALAVLQGRVEIQLAAVNWRLTEEKVLVSSLQDEIARLEVSHVEETNALEEMQLAMARYQQEMCRLKSAAEQDRKLREEAFAELDSLRRQGESDTRAVVSALIHNVRKHYYFLCLI